MESLVSALTPVVSELFVVLVGALIAYLTKKISPVLNNAKKLREIEIIDRLTDTAVEFAEKEFSGELGKVKREKAVNLAIKLLAERGIVVSREEILAGIENGVRKLNK